MFFECLLIIVAIWLLYYIYSWNQQKFHTDLHRRPVLITGCDTGFGRAAARRLDSLGCPVIAGCLKQESVDQLKQELLSSSLPILMDVTDHQSVLDARRKVEQFLKERNHPHLWGVVNNAGVASSMGPTIWYDGVDRLLPTINVNTLGLIDVTCVFLPLIVPARGRLVNIASIMGRIGTPFSPGYVTSKFAVEGFTDSLRRELLPLGVRVVTLEPGFHETNITDQERIKQEMLNQSNNLPDDRKVFSSESAINRILEALDVVKTIAGRPGVEPVVEAIRKGLFLVRPPTRYSIGRDAKICFIPASYLPDCLVDFVCYLMGPKM